MTRLMRAACAALILLVLPLCSLLLLPGTHEVPVAALRPLRPYTPRIFNIDGLRGRVEIRGAVCPDQADVTGTLRVRLVGETPSETSVWVRERMDLSVGLPEVGRVRLLELTFEPSNREGGGLLVERLSVAWKHTGYLQSGVAGAVRAWLPVTLPRSWPTALYGIALLTAVISAGVAGLMPRTASWRLPPWWSWLFLCAALVCADHASFSPLTRMEIVPGFSLAAAFLFATGVVFLLDAAIATRRTLAPACVVFLVAVAVRLIVSTASVDRRTLDIDETVYAGMGASLAAGRGMIVPDEAYKSPTRVYPDPVRRSWWQNRLYLGVARQGERTAAVPPGYPSFIALLRGLGIDSLSSLLVLQGLIGACTCGLSYVIAYRLFGARAGLIAMTLGAVHSPAVAATGYVFTETVFAFLVLGSLLTVVAARPRLSLLGGMILGAAALTRSVALPLCPLWLAFMAIRRRWIQALLFLVGFGMATSPWALRNYRLLGEPRVSSTFAGKDFFVGNNDQYRRSGVRAPPKWPALDQTMRALLRIARVDSSDVARMFEFPAEIPSEATRDREVRQRFLAFAITHPGSFFRLTMARLQELAGMRPGPELWEHVGCLPFLFLSAAIIGLAGLVGTGSVRHRMLILVSIAVLMAPPSLSVAYPHYRLPADWLVFCLAGAGLANLADWAKGGPLKGHAPGRWLSRP